MEGGTLGHHYDGKWNKKGYQNKQKLLLLL
jgi:hypothetical protein